MKKTVLLLLIIFILTGQVWAFEIERGYGAASNITNDSTVAGATVEEALNTLADAGADIWTPAVTGDGVANDTSAINTSLAACYAAGGGIVQLPCGHFKTTTPIEVRDNCQLVGKGYCSWIDNQATSGFNKVTVATGNIGDITGGTSLYSETSYDLNAITAGDVTVTFASMGDASTFVVGDIVGIMSSEVWASDTNYPVFNNLNIVTAKDAGTGVLTLKYAIPDTYTTGSGAPQIARMSGSIVGYDGNPLWMAKNAAVKNLRLTSVIGLSSSWYALYPHGVGHTFENLWMDNTGGCIGSNGLAYSLIKDLTCQFDMRALDMADFQINNTLDHLTLNRIAQNSVNPGSMAGVAVYSGSDLTVTNLDVNLGDIGRVAFSYIHRLKLLQPHIMRSGGSSPVSLIVGWGYDAEVTGAVIDRGEGDGMYVISNRARIHNNTITNIASLGSGVGMYVKNDVQDYMITNNTLGIDGARTANDVISWQATQSTKGVLSGNKTYDGSVNTLPANLAATAVPTIDASCTGWTLGTGWACGGDGTITKNADGTGTASYDASSVEATGNNLYRSYTTTGISGGSITPSHCGATTTAVSTNSTFPEYYKCADSSSNLTFTPSVTGVRVVLSAVTVQKASGGTSTVTGGMTVTSGQLKTEFVGTSTYPNITIGTSTTGFQYAATGILYAQLGGTRKISIDTNVSLANAYIGDGTLANFVRLKSDGANILALQNSTTAQELRVYGTTSGSKYLSLKHDGTNGIITTSSGNVTLTGTVVLTTTASPASNAACAAGTISWDADYIYICTASGAVKRAALTGGY